MSLIFVMLASAFAQETPAVEDLPVDAPVIYKAVTEVDMTGVDVTAELVKPTGGLITSVRRPVFHSLARIRHDFDAEMLASVDDIH